MMQEAEASGSGVPANEPERLEAVRRYDILDTPPDGAFDRVTRLAARLFQVPISIVSIVDEDRIWFKSHHGLDVQEVGRDPGLCASAILQDDPWVVSNAATDPRALANPLVAGALGLRFYAGVPLQVRGGSNLGTLCVIDQRPREVTEAEVATLSDLAAVVVDELELRLSANRVLALEAERRRLAEAEAESLKKVSESLQAGMESNREIGKALGLLMAFHEINDTDAFKILRKASNDMNVKLNQIADEVVRHHNGRGTDTAALTAFGPDGSHGGQQPVRTPPGPDPGSLD